MALVFSIATVSSSVSERFSAPSTAAATARRLSGPALIVAKASPNPSLPWSFLKPVAKLSAALSSFCDVSSLAASA